MLACTSRPGRQAGRQAGSPTDATLYCCPDVMQEVSGQGQPVTRPLKVEEGLLLAALEVAANQGNIELAEATFKVSMGGVGWDTKPADACHCMALP